ncbi:MAG: hypothetical protein U0U46_07840 [Saprospiraceae bacterium]
MSLFSLLFGCGGKKTPEAARAWPQFPATDNPAVHIEPIALDSAYTPRAFFISDKADAVFVLAYRPAIDNPRTPYERAEAAGRIFRLDSKGNILQRLDIPDTQWVPEASFGILEGELLVLLWQHFAVIDPERLTIKGEIPVYDYNYFPCRLKLEEMTYDELRDNYLIVRDDALDHCKEGRWLDWSPGGAFFVLATSPNGKRAAWSPNTYIDEDIEPLKQRFPLLQLTLPSLPEGEISDERGRLREVEYLSGGTQLDYPNYKSRLIKQHELRLGNTTARFSTTDRNRRALHLDYANNLRLTTADGAAWVCFEGVLYRIR